MPRPLATRGAPLPQDVRHGACRPRPRSGQSPRGVRVCGARMAAKRVTHARPIRGADQGLPGSSEPGVPPPLPPGTHHHQRRPKGRPQRRRPHQPTNSHQHSRPGSHAPTGPHRRHGRARWHTLPLPPPSRHPPLPHRHVLRGPYHSTRQRSNLRGPPARGQGPPTPLHRLHHPEHTPTRGHPTRRHPPTHTTVPGRE